MNPHPALMQELAKARQADMLAAAKADRESALAVRPKRAARAAAWIAALASKRARRPRMAPEALQQS